MKSSSSYKFQESPEGFTHEVLAIATSSKINQRVSHMKSSYSYKFQDSPEGFTHEV